jgi:hypothetical protein
MQALNTHLGFVTELPVPSNLIGPLRAVEARELRRNDEDWSPDETSFAVVDGELVVDLEFSQDGRCRFVRTPDGCAHVQYLTRSRERGYVLEADWPVNMDDVETIARTIWTMIGQVIVA